MLLFFFTFYIAQSCRSQKLSVYSCVSSRLFWSGWGILLRHIRRQNVGHTWLQSQRSLTHCGETCRPTIQVKVSATEGQTYVFISIILHNNTAVFFGEAQKRENRFNKRSPNGTRPYLGKCLLISPDWNMRRGCSREQLRRPFWKNSFESDSLECQQGAIDRPNPSLLKNNAFMHSVHVCVRVCVLAHATHCTLLARWIHFGEVGTFWLVPNCKGQLKG